MDKHSERISKLKDKIKCPNLKYHQSGYKAEVYKDLRLTRKLKDVSIKLYNEYDKENNVKKVDNVQIGDTSKRRWICPDCGRGWYASPAERYNVETGEIVLNCRFCERKRKYAETGLIPRQTEKQVKNLVYNHPEMLMYFNGYSNYVDIFKIQQSQKYEIHWKCFRCGYEFDCSPHDINYNNICPACGRRLIKGFNDYKSMYPEQSIDLDLAEKLNSKKSSEVHYKQKGLLHWKCKDCGHTFMVSPLDTILKQRTCPKCNTIGNRWNNLLNFVDTDLNQVEDIQSLRGDSPRKVHWTCEYGHKYEKSLRDRTSNFFGCPECIKNEYIDWQYTNLLDVLTSYNIEYKALDKIGSTQVKDINNNGNLSKYVQIKNMIIRVQQEYVKLSQAETVKTGKDFKKVAEQQSLEPFEIVETVNQVNTDLKFQEVDNKFEVPLNRWCDNIYYINTIVKWLINYRDLR